MVLFRESPYIMLILLCWVGWLFGLAFGQVGEAFTGSANFSNIQITCIANLAAFLHCILQDKLSVEEFDEFTWGEHTIHRVNKIDGVVGGWTTSTRQELSKCSVVMLSPTPPFHSVRKFMIDLSSLYGIDSIFLQYRPLQSVTEVPKEIRKCEGSHIERCGCIVFNAVEDIIKMLARRMPGTVKRLSDSGQCLLPSLQCLRNGCHECKDGLLLHLENDILREGESEMNSPAAVCEVLDCKSINKARTCICIPVRSDNDDEWTNKLITFFKPNPMEYRGAVIRKSRTGFSSALENYKNKNGECDAVEKYKNCFLMLVPFFTVALIIPVLTFWLKVDGFTSFCFAWKAMENYFLLNCNFFNPYTFLTKARVKSNANKTNICQVFQFEGGLQTFVLLGSLSWCVPLICSISWMVLVAEEGGANKWYHTHSMEPSKPRILVILVGIFIALLLDAFELKSFLKIRFKGYRIQISIICEIIVLEIACIVACSAIARVMGKKDCGRWIYSALQCLVWLKFLVGRFVFWCFGRHRYGEPTWWYGKRGLYIRASAFLLNATLAGVRATWEF